MSTSVSPNKLMSLSVFDQILNESSTDVVQFEKGSIEHLKSGGTYRAWNLLGRLLRFKSNKTANNEIRTQLLRSLAVATGIADKNDVVRLTEAQVNALKTKLGKGVLCDERSDAFQLNDEGQVISGSPLTKRRITRILKRLEELKPAGTSIEAPEGGLKTTSHDGLDVRDPKVGESFKFTELLKQDELDTFKDHLNDCLWELGIADPTLRDENGKIISVDDAVLKMFNGLKGAPGSKNAFVDGVNAYNMALARAKPTRSPISAEDLFAKLNVSYDPQVAAQKRIKLLQDTERRSMRVFAYYVAAAAKLPKESPELVRKASPVAIWQKIGCSMKSTGQGKPTLFNFYMGVGAVLQDTQMQHFNVRENKFSGLMERLTNNINSLTKHACEALELSTVAKTSANDTERIQKWLLGIFEKLKSGAFANESAFLRTVCDAFIAEVLGNKHVDGDAKARLVDELRLVLGALLFEITSALTGWVDDALNVKDIANETGGLIQNEMSFAFKHTFGSETKDFKSTVTPVGADVDVRGKVEDKKTDSVDGNQIFKKRQVLNLMMSKLSVGGKDGQENTLVSFLRFGQDGFRYPSHYEPKSSEQTDETVKELKLKERRIDAYQTLAKTILMNNAELLGKAKAGGVVNVPIYRVDMSCTTNNDMTLPDGEELPEFEMQLEEGGPTVRIKPEVHNFFLSMGNVQTDDAQVARTKKELEALLARAKSALEQSDVNAGGVHNDKDLNKIRKLYASLEKFFKENFASQDISQGGYKLKALLTKPGKMLPLGAQVTMLASLLGETPAINCHSGYEETSIMDSEIKMLAAQLEQDENADLTIGDQYRGDESIKLRTEFLRNTGNIEIAQLTGNPGLYGLMKYRDGGLFDTFNIKYAKEPLDEIIEG